MRQFFSSHLVDTALLSIAVALHAGALWLVHRDLAHDAPARRRWHFRLALSLLLIILGFSLDIQSWSRQFPGWFFVPVRTATLAWSMIACGLFVMHLVQRTFLRPATRRFSPARRQLIERVSYAAPALALGYGTFIERDNFRVETIDLRLPALAPDLHGLRLVQLTDVHLGPFLAESEFARMVDAANEVKADIALMTGDLISRVGDPLDACLRQLARVKSAAGLYGCLGNHEIYALAEDYTEREGRRLGLHFLRHQRRTLRFGQANLHLSGVDYQRRAQPYLVGTGHLRVPGECNLLLSHNPDVFPVAARQGFDLTISGHTHGGQVTVEYLHQYLNVARFATPFVSGHYQIGPAQLYVSRGLGTVGIPTRLGARPELTVIRLCAI
jgi:predicted MPP superfamily phosphohydrolase